LPETAISFGSGTGLARQNHGSTGAQVHVMDEKLRGVGLLFHDLRRHANDGRLGVGASAMMRIGGCKTRSVFGRCPSLQQAAGEQACEAGPAHDCITDKAAVRGNDQFSIRIGFAPMVTLEAPASGVTFPFKSCQSEL
jgi:hypothetical protein